MEGTKFCPVIKADCKREQCAWWDEELEVCAVLSMMFALWAEADEDEDEDEESPNGNFERLLDSLDEEE